MKLIIGNKNYSSWSLRPWMLMKGLGIGFEDRVEPFAKPVNYDELRGYLRACCAGHARRNSLAA